MYDCSKAVCDFHNEKVTLSQCDRTAMRDRRNANRDRLRRRLKERGKPLPEKFIKQGSYAMLTMVQDPDNDYDIDDGVYYCEEMLIDKDGVPLPISMIKEMVCDSLYDERFSKQPKVMPNCVRVFYNEGYHVDLPIYRIRKIDHEYELAACDTWKVSRAADVEEWFNKANQSKSPDAENGRQLRRIVRMAKKFARSRTAWKDVIATGFTITKLVEECYVPHNDRDDASLRETMQVICDRLSLNLEVQHPVTPGEMLTQGADDPKTKFLLEKLRDALSDLAVLDKTDCSEEQAMEAWNRVFNTDFFSLFMEKHAMNFGILSRLATDPEIPRAVDKRGGGRFA